MMKLLFNVMVRIILIPVWLVLAIAWIMTMLVVRMGYFAKGLASTVLLLILVGTLIWFRTDWMRYVLLAVAEGILFAVVFAGTIMEVALGGLRAKVGGMILFRN